MHAECPTCLQEYGPKNAKKLRGVTLSLLRHNYSGCGVDMAYCPMCGKGYKVDKVTPDPAWDVTVEVDDE